MSNTLDEMTAKPTPPMTMDSLMVRLLNIRDEIYETAVYPGSSISEAARKAEIIAEVYKGFEALIAREQEKLLAELEKDAKYNYTTWGNSNKMLSVDGINKWIAAKRQALNKIIEERQ